MTKTAKKARKSGLILLKDLAPGKDPKGAAAGKTVFGIIPPGPSAGDQAPPPGRAKRKKS